MGRKPATGVVISMLVCGLLAAAVALSLSDQVAIVYWASGSQRRELRVGSTSIALISFSTSWDTWARQTRWGLLRDIGIDPQKWIGMDVTSSRSFAGIASMTGELRSGFETVAPGRVSYYVADMSALRFPTYFPCIGCGLIDGLTWWSATCWVGRGVGKTGGKKSGDPTSGDGMQPVTS